MKKKYIFTFIGVLSAIIVICAIFIYNKKADTTTISPMVSLGYEHSAVIKEDGSLWLWGNNSCGQLGFGKKVEVLTAPKKLMDDVKCISLNDDTSAAVKSDGSLWIWGKTPIGTEKTAGGLKCSYTPINILNDVTYVVLGGWNGAAIKNDGSLWMWGENSFGSVGNGTYDDWIYPPVKVLDDVKSVKLSMNQSAAIKNDGSVWMWGGSAFPIEPFSEAMKGSNAPKKVIDNVEVEDIGLMTGNDAILIDGVVWEWNEANIVPKKTDAVNVRKLIWENYNNAIIKKDNSMWVIEDNTYVKIMDNVQSASLGGFGGTYYASITTDGELYMWGNNDRGQLGDGTTNSISVPKRIMSLK